MELYKEGHGVLVRRVAFVAVAALVLWGGLTVYDWFQFDLVREHRMSDYQIPVIRQYLDPAFFLCWILVAAGWVFSYRFLNQERQADFLIETDTEVRKVTWPTWKDAINSSLVVLVFVVVVTFYILACDFVLTHLIKFILPHE